MKIALVRNAVLFCCLILLSGCSPGTYQEELVILRTSANDEKKLRDELSKIGSRFHELFPSPEIPNFPDAVCFSFVVQNLPKRATATYCYSKKGEIATVSIGEPREKERLFFSVEAQKVFDNISIMVSTIFSSDRVTHLKY